MNQSTEAHKLIGVVKAVFAQPLRVAMLKNGVVRHQQEVIEDRAGGW